MALGFADLLTLWSHALAALLFGVLALWAWRVRRARAFGLAIALTALWALAVAGIGEGDPVTRLAETARNLGWLWFVWRLQPRSDAGSLRRAASVSHASVAGVTIAGGTLGAAGLLFAAPDSANALADSAIVLRLLAAVAGLVLLQNAYARTAGNATRITLLGVAAIWLVDINLLTLVWATREWSSAMQATRGAVLVAVAAILAANAERSADRPVQLSRAVAVQSLSLLALLSYLAIFAGVTQALEALGGRQARLLQTAFVCGTTAAALAVLSTPRLRAWLRVKVAKHLFRHRYDYRAEWMRFTATLGRRDDDADLGERVTRALAELLDSPSGLLLACEGGALIPMARWRWDDTLPAGRIEAAPLVAHLTATGRIVELDAVRRGDAPRDAIAVSPALIEERDLWAIVPLPHPGGLIGVVLLSRPPIDRTLDWEDFDLLKVAGRQAAASLAEYLAQARLAESERFDEFNRRFAFILHDIKNLVSQISLVARNAERHADNPAFRTDMISTLNESATRMGELVARLSPSRAAPAVSPRATPVMAIARTIAARGRSLHPVAVAGDEHALAHADPAGVEQILRHLIQNAIDASPPALPVNVTIAALDNHVRIDVIDRGSGMSATFVRDKLFRPFVSTKAAGFGIGAYEARSLALAMGGTLDVASREGEGTRFTLTLPAAAAMPTGDAA